MPYLQMSYADEWSCVPSVGVCCVSGVTVDTDEHWCSQINRLQQLIDKLECQVNASKCPFTQNNLYVFRMYIEILVCFSFLESKVGATERRYTVQHVQISEFSDPPLQKHLPLTHDSRCAISEPICLG